MIKGWRVRRYSRNGEACSDFMLYNHVVEGAIYSWHAECKKIKQNKTKTVLRKMCVTCWFSGSGKSLEQSVLLLQPPSKSDYFPLLWS